MDHFGIGNAIEAMTNMYFQSARGSGRTTSLIESLKEGDKVCFQNNKEADRVKSLCKERGFEIETVVINPEMPERLFEREKPKGRLIFDHGWVEQYFVNQIKRGQKDIDYFQREASGYGTAHEETKFRAKEISKWHI